MEVLIMDAILTEVNYEPVEDNAYEQAKREVALETEYDQACVELDAMTGVYD